jgi:NAD(P)-dependent dehydrogenase (short-subunit alcohol dehydrogenase family)
MNIEGAVVLVTGAGSGIGRATARRLARDGAMVGINDIDEGRALDSVRLIEQDGGRAMPLSADVAMAPPVMTQPEEIAEAVVSIVNDESLAGRVMLCVGPKPWPLVEPPKPAS